MNSNALVVINNGAPIGGQLLKGANKSHLQYETSDGTFVVTANDSGMTVKFTGEGVGYTLTINDDNSSLSLEFNGNQMGYSAIDKKIYRFSENETGIFLTAEYTLEGQAQSITLSATLI